MKQMVATEQIENIKTDSEIVDVVNNAIEKGDINVGEELYVHQLFLSIQTAQGTSNYYNFRCEYHIITNDATPFTRDTLYTFLNSISSVSGTTIKRINAVKTYISGYGTNTVYVYEDDLLSKINFNTTASSSHAKEIYFKARIRATYDSDWQVVSTYCTFNNSNLIVEDAVIPLNMGNM